MTVSFKHLAIGVAFAVCAMPIGTVTAQNDYPHTKDSLLHVIASTDGQDKLDAFYTLHTLAFEQEEEMDSVVKIYNAYIAEAKRQDMPKEVGMIYTNLLAAYANRQMMDEVAKQAPAVLDYLASNDLWDGYYRTYATILEGYFFDNQLQKVVEEANKLYAFSKTHKSDSGMSSALYSLALVYQKTGRYAKAEESFRACIQLQKKLKEKTSLLTQAYYYLYEILSLDSQRKAEWKPLIDEWAKAIGDYEAEKKLVNSLGRAQIYGAKALLEYNNERYESALLYVDSALIATPSDYSTRANAYFLRAHIFYRQDKDPEALSMIEQANEIYTEFNEESVLIALAQLKINCMLSLRGSSDMIPMVDALFARKDSLTNHEFQAQIDELNTVYKVDQLTAEKQITRLQLSLALIVCLLLLVALTLYVFYSRRLKRKNAALFDRIQEMTQVAEKSDIQLSARPDDTLSREMQLFRRINDLMRQSKPFTDQELTRKTLADLLNTNEIYLADAIREGTGLTFSNYIAELRLHYSLALLADKLDMTLEAVAVDTGFGSYSPFYRAFIKKYGINPSEYRRLSMQKSRSANKEEGAV